MGPCLNASVKSYSLKQIRSINVTSFVVDLVTHIRIVKSREPSQPSLRKDVTFMVNTLYMNTIISLCKIYSIFRFPS